MHHNYTQAVEIAKDVYWVGVYMEDDTFQCHTYLIIDGDESILIDSGSMLEFENVKRKIESLIDIHNIKYLVAHHQDPDVCANIPAFEKLIGRDDLYVVSHSRNFALIKHYGLSSNFYVIENHNFQLKTEHYKLLFITTPYAHSPGAFVTYLQEKKVLFSSDIFGGLEESWHFYAQENYFDEIKLFHKEYMPSRDILNYSLSKIEKLNLELIAPQHGSIIQRKYIHSIIDSLKKLECGLYIDASYATSLIEAKNREEQHAKKLNTVLDSLENIIVISTNGIEVDYINQAFFRFNNFKDYDEFRQKHKCICDCFVDYEGNSYLKSHYDNGENWISIMLNNPDKEFFAVIKNSERVNSIFKVTIKQIENGKFLVSFHDVTIYQENMQFINIISQMQGVYFTITNMEGVIESTSNVLLDALHVYDFRAGKYKNSDFMNEKDMQIAMQYVQNNNTSSYEVVLRHNDIAIPVLMQGYYGVINHKAVRVVVAVDLREIKKLQKEAKQQELLLIQQSKMAQMGEMISMIAHQWRQPLNAISAASIKSRMKYEMDLLDVKEFSSTQKFIEDQCQKMSKVIDTFMNFSNNGGKEEIFSFEKVMNVIMDLIDGQLSSHGINLDIKTIDTLELFGDASMLEQIIINILVNARDAYDENRNLTNKTIIIKVFDKRVEIIDFAGGIDKSKREKIFMPYFTTKEQLKGTGLGLYMSKKIMKEHFKGDIYYVGVDKQSKFILDFESTREGGGAK